MLNFAYFKIYKLVDAQVTPTTDFDFIKSIFLYF